MNTLIKAIVTITATGLLAAPSDPALADQPQQGQALLTPDTAKAVVVADLDLSKPEHIRTLYQRIRRAARLLCDTEHSALWDVKRQLHRRQCFELAVDNAVNGAMQPELTALHRGAGGRVAGL